MKIDTKFLGEVEIAEQDIFTFEQGLMGLEEYKKFTLLSLDVELPLVLLQSTECAEISFILAFPYAFKSDYIFDISQEDQEQLQLEKEEDVLSYVIITLKEPFSNSTLNLLAPIVMNPTKKLGKQIVLHQTDYPLRYPVPKVVKESGK
ncbi:MULTISPECIES: flagellar assembly protein FliW [unclassified Lysinibacillus]|uniref:flagellar assembly protein FliW n=1 Tax=unclassified Lysinibacillus TaxID=2636778 RepID=UPI00103A89E7|nr:MULTISPECIES: flagellar assembly protein FliW [unclassified Lysinibacillus]MCM0626375.1 flagellar assembly protein FliW [Lysinibacillus sp. OL1_EC]TBV85758.1 flagellar assembly protein FliW [Lysinibacillus sp. OL1]